MSGFARGGLPNFPTRLEQYQPAVVDSVRRKDGKKLAELLSLRRISRGLGHYLARMEVRQMSFLRSLDDGLQPVIEAQLTAAGLLADGKKEDAVKHQGDALKALAKYLKAIMAEEGMFEGDWLIPVMRKIAREARLLGQKLHDSQKASAGDMEAGSDPDSPLKHVAIGLAGVFRDFSGTSASARRDLALILSNEMMVSYLYMNNPRMSKPLTDWLDGRLKLNAQTMIDVAGAEPGSFHKGDVVMCLYCRGRLVLLDGDYAKSEEFLDIAFRHCDKRSYRNVRAILHYLIPVKLMLNKLPTRKLLDDYSLADEYLPLTTAFRLGDVRAYEALLAQKMHELIVHGFFIMLEKVKVIVYRNFFKRCWLLMGKADKVSIEALFRLHQAVYPQSDMDEAELECYLAILISMNKVKGYIAHARKIIVLSKTAPFPPLVLK